MTQSRIPPKTDHSPQNGQESSPSDELQRLRELINAPVEERLYTLKNHVENPQQQIEDVARVLPQAVNHQEDKGKNLAKAMAPIVDDAIGVSVRKNPKPVVDALYPIIGPAIRKSIATALQGMLQNFNRALEQSLSARSFKWRLEAMRTGQTFSEVVLMNTLEYQVEEVFLIHKVTGLLLLHESTERVENGGDRDLVSGMLTAIKEFVKDSFSSDEQDELETFRVGQLTVLVEQGPEAILAVAVRGTPPETLKPLLVNTIEQIHLNHAFDLTEFSGDNTIFEASRSSLQECLVRQFQEKKRSFSPVFWIINFLIIAAILFWALWTYKEKQVWREFLAELKQQPGIMVTSAKDEAGVMIIEGLKDPLAVDPKIILHENELDADDVRFVFSPYISLENELVRERVLLRLSPPSGLDVEINNGIVTAKGVAPVHWLMQSALTLSNFPGVQEFKVSSETVLNKIQEIEAQSILFAQGRAEFDEPQEETLNKIVVLLKDLDRLAESFGDIFKVIITGYTDETGGDEVNQLLSEMRADAVYNQLAEKGLLSLDMEKVAGGVKEIDASESMNSAKCVNLCVKWQPSKLWLNKEQE